MKDQIVYIIIESLKELNKKLRMSELENPIITTRLYGSQGNLDSLALVKLSVELEGRISDEFDKEVTLDDISGYGTIGSLANYIEEVINEKD